MVLIGMPEAAKRAGVARSSILRALEAAGVPIHKINEKAFAVDDADLAKFVEARGGTLRPGRPKGSKNKKDTTS
jgi:hypothetical protein